MMVCIGTAGDDGTDSLAEHSAGSFSLVWFYNVDRMQAHIDLPLIVYCWYPKQSFSIPLS